MENRRSLRFEVELACRLRWGHVREALSGITQNISRGGALISCWPSRDGRNMPRVGDSLEMHILLPHSNVFGQKALVCRTVVVRIIRSLVGSYEIALNFEQLQFREAKKLASSAPAPGAGRSREVLPSEKTS
jgi:hypothetical protein